MILSKVLGVNKNIQNVEKKPQENKAEVNNTENKGNKKKLTSALAGLAVLGMATAGVVYCAKTGKLDGLKKTTEKAGEVVKESADDAAKAVEEKVKPTLEDIENKFISGVLDKTDRTLKYFHIAAKEGSTERTLSQVSAHMDRLAAQSADAAYQFKLRKHGMPFLETKKLAGCLYHIATTECRDSANNVTPKMQGLMKEFEKYSKASFPAPESLVEFVKSFTNNNMTRFAELFNNPKELEKFASAFV